MKIRARKRNAAETFDVQENSTPLPNAKRSKRSQKRPAKPKRSNRYRKVRKPQPFPVSPIPPKLTFDDDKENQSDVEVCPIHDHGGNVRNIQYALI